VRRGPVATLLALLLAACAGTEDADGPPPTQAHAYPVPEREAVIVQVVNIPAGTEVTAIELRTADGVLTPEARERRETVSSGASAAPEIGVGAHGGSSTGVEPHLTLSFSLFDWFWGGDEATNGELKSTEGHALLARIPVPEDQREAIAGRTVTITFQDVAGTQQTRTTRVQAE